jgi:hypothetical protein
MPPHERRPTDKSTEGMVDYHRNSKQQSYLVAGGARWIHTLVPEIGIVDPEFRIVDYGCGPGGTAIAAVQPALDAYRGLNAAAPVVVVHADQASNDWNALFALVAGPDGYGQNDRNLRIEASAGDFYGAMAAPGSVALGTCYTSIHWMSQALRLYAPGTVLHSEMPDAARTEMAALADADWQSFLHHRARELRPGGCLVVISVGSGIDPERPDGRAVTSQRLFRAVQIAAESLADDGRLDRDTLDRFVFPCWFRTADEFRQPLEQVPALRAAFDILDISVAPSAYNPTDTYADDLADPDRYSDRYTGFLRGFGDSTLRLQLFGPGAKNQNDVDALAAKFYRRFGRLYRDSPGKYATETWVSTVVLRRR